MDTLTYSAMRRRHNLSLLLTRVKQYHGDKFLTALDQGATNVFNLVHQHDIIILLSTIIINNCYQ